MAYGEGPYGAGPYGGTPEREFPVRFDLGEAHPANSIITVSGLVGDALVQHFYRDPNALLRIDRRKFEELIAEIFAGFGYDVGLTQRTRDGGKDIVAVRRAEVDVRYLIECKRPDPGNPVGVRPVRELYGVKTMEGATKAILATTAQFTRDAQVLLDRHRWELEGRDYDGIRAWIEAYISRSK
jgi:restriction endonuclease Mrr